MTSGSDSRSPAPGKDCESASISRVIARETRRVPEAGTERSQKNLNLNLLPGSKDAAPHAIRVL
jgi:hypothetical protein